MPVLKEFKLHKELFVGILPANPRSLFLSNEQLQDPMDMLMSKEGGGENIESLISSPESLLQKLSTEKSKATSSVNDSDKKLIDEMLSNSKESSNKKPARLIEEIGKFFIPRQVPDLNTIILCFFFVCSLFWLIEKDSYNDKNSYKIKKIKFMF